MNGRTKSPRTGHKWRSRGYAIRASHHLQRHLVALRVIYRVQGKTYQPIFSGFVVKAGHELLWATAGHCLEEINKIHACSEARIISCELLDSHTSGWNQGIPIGKVPPRGALLDRAGVDVGFIPLRRGFAAPLESSPNFDPLLLDELGGPMEDAEGCFLVGFPGSWVDPRDWPVGNGWRQAVVDATIGCFPVHLIPDPGEQPEDGGFGGRSRVALYGRIKLHKRGAGDYPRSLKGLSGGMLVAFKRERKGMLSYRVVGIMSACLGPNTIRATRIESLPALVQLVVETAVAEQDAEARSTQPRFGEALIRDKHPSPKEANTNASLALGKRLGVKKSPRQRS